MEEWRNQLLHIYLHTRVPASVELNPEPDEKIQLHFQADYMQMECTHLATQVARQWAVIKVCPSQSPSGSGLPTQFAQSVSHQKTCHVTQQSKALDVTLISRIGKRLKLCNLGDLNFNLVCVLLSRPPHWLFHLRHSMWFRLNIYFDLITQKNIHPNRRDNRSIINGEMNSLLYI